MKRNRRYVKKPVAIEAYQTDKELEIHTLEGVMKASVNDYIITGVRGEQYPCKPDIFEQTYIPADSSKMVYVASLFGKEIGETFKVKYPNSVPPFKAVFTESGIRLDNPFFSANDVLVMLLAGKAEIV